MECFKFHGAGNDFIMCDVRESSYLPDKITIQQVCDRHFGIGADGLILMEKGKNDALFMRYFNSDGNEASMCGNGARCFAAFAHMLGIYKNELVFEASDGTHHAQIIHTENTSEWQVSVSLNLVDSPIEWPNGFWFVNTGVPHLVVPSNDIATIDVNNTGRSLRFHPDLAPDGANVNFVELRQNTIHIRTYERGVEGETLACGTGITASALSMALANNLASPISVKALGGNLEVLFERKEDIFSCIKLQGPAKFVFSTHIDWLGR